MTAPVAPDERAEVAVVTSPGGSGVLRPLAAALERHVRLVSSERATAPVAVLASDPAALRVALGSGPTASARSTATAVDGTLHVTSLEGAPVELALPGPDGVTTRGLPPLTPHVRRRWRRRLGLPPDLVVDTATLDPDDVPTALAVASAALVDRPHLPMALALGCPTVTDAVAAESVGARHGEEVVVGGRADAEALAADDLVAAPLSRRGRALAVTTLDPEVTAARVVEAWGLADRSPRGRLVAALAELGTAPGSIAARRARDATAIFSSAPPGGR